MGVERCGQGHREPDTRFEICSQFNNPLQSPHPGGLLAACVDGSVQFIPESADFAVLLRYVIRDDGQLMWID